MNLVELFDQRVAKQPEAPAIFTSHRGVDTSTSFEALAESSRRIATEFRRRGLAAGDPVLVLVPMSARLYEVLIALWRVGATAVFLDPSAGLGHIARCCEILPPKAVVAPRIALLLRLVSPALRRIPLAVPVDALANADAPALATAASVTDDDSALVTFTSGSTGLPKAAVRAHGFLATQYDVLARHLELARGQIDLATLPIFVLANLGAGVTTVIPDADLRRVGSVDAAPVVAQISRLDVTRASGSPSFLQRLAEHCEREGVTLDWLASVHTGGAPVFPSLLDRLGKIAPNASIHAVYGSTEAEPIASFRLQDLAAEDRAAMKSGSGLFAGPPVPEIELRVVRAEWGAPLGPFTPEAFGATWCHPGEAGEIVVSGAHVLPGYLGGRGDSETKFEVAGVRWHRTGDAGCHDADGRLWLLGRAGSVICDERGTLHPFAVECALSGFPGVARTALLGWRGRRILLVEPEDGTTLEPDHVLSAVPWAGLDECRIVRHIPVDKRHNAKVDYPALERMMARRR